MKKAFVFIILATFLWTNGVFAYEMFSTDITDYRPLAGEIPGITDAQRTIEGDSIGEFAANVYRFVITLTIILAVVMFIYNGFMYATTDIIPRKRDAREGLKNVILGLLLVLGAYLILFTINPNLVKFDFGVSIDSSPLSQGTTTIVSNVNTPCDELSRQIGINGRTPSREGVYAKKHYPCTDSSGNRTQRAAYVYVESYDALQRANPGNMSPTSSQCNQMVQADAASGVNSYCTYFVAKYKADITFDATRLRRNNYKTDGYIVYPANAPTMEACQHQLNQYRTNTNNIQWDQNIKKFGEEVFVTKVKSSTCTPNGSGGFKGESYFDYVVMDGDPYESGLRVTELPGLPANLNACERIKTMFVNNENNFQYNYLLSVTNRHLAIKVQSAQCVLASQNLSEEIR